MICPSGIGRIRKKNEKEEGKCERHNAANSAQIDRIGATLRNTKQITLSGLSMAEDVNQDIEYKDNVKQSASKG